MSTSIDTTNTTAAPPPMDSAPPSPKELSPVEATLAALQPLLEPLFEDARHLASFRVAVLQAAIAEPDLQRCTSVSLADAILGCARLGLMPHGLEAHAALTVRADDRSGETRAECTVMVNGLCHMAVRDGRAVEIIAETVREGDLIKYRPAEKLLEHEPLFPRPDRIVAAYACVELPGGRKLYEMVDHADLEAAESASRGNIAWHVWKAQMCKKTARRRAVLANGLLSPLTSANLALSQVRVELDHVVGRAEPKPTEAPRPATSAASEVAVPRAASPSAQKILDKIDSNKAARGESPAAKPADPPAAPAAPSASKPTATSKASASTKASTGKGKGSPKAKKGGK